MADSETTAHPYDGASWPVVAVAGGSPGRVYFIASVGIEGNGWLTSDESYAFDPSTGEWEEMPAHPLDEALTEAEAVGTDDGLYLVGRGCEVRRTTGSAYPCGADGSWVGAHFDIESEEWTALELPEQLIDDEFSRIDRLRPVPHVTRNATHLFWELIDRSGFVSDLLVLDIATRSWTTVEGAVPLSVGSCVVDETLYGLRPGSLTTAFGQTPDADDGLRGSLVTVSANGEVTEEPIEIPSADEAGEPMPTYRTFCTAEYLLVGDPHQGLPSASAWFMRSIATGQWREVPRLHDGSPRIAIAALGTDEHLYVLGRESYGQPSGPVVMFTPADATWDSVPATQGVGTRVQSVVVDRDALVMYESAQPSHAREFIVVTVD